MHALRRLSQLSARDLADLMRAIWYLLSSRIEFGVRPAKSILDDLSKPEPADPGDVSDSELAIERIGWAVRAAARRVPWRADCLIQAMAAAAWMRREGLAPGFHLGVARGDDGGITGHAWLTFGDRVVVGDGVGPLEQFAAMMTSPSPPAGRTEPQTRCRAS